MDARQRIVVADEHALLRAGVRALLAKDAKLEVVGEAANAEEALKAVAALNPRLVIVDLSLPGLNGMEAISQIRRRFPEVLVLVMTLQPGEAVLHASLKAGANGYILKHASKEEFLAAIATVLQGKIYLGAHSTGQRAGGADPHMAERATSYDLLTAREREVLKLVAEGRSNKWIANLLCVSAKTVEKHRGNLMRKLGVHNASMLTAYAMAEGLVLLDRDHPQDQAKD